MDDKYQNPIKLNEQNLNLLRWQNNAPTPLNSKLPLSRFIQESQNLPTDQKLYYKLEHLPKSLSFESCSEATDDISVEMKALGDAVQSNMSDATNFNCMVIGNSGLGKTTFINSFLDRKFSRIPDLVENYSLHPSTRAFVHNKATRTENGLQFNIDFIDTPGYGSYKSIDIWIKMMKSMINSSAFEYYAQKKKKRPVERSDTRIHLALFFIDGVRLKDVDKRAMFELQRYVNIIPVVAKADQFSNSEVMVVKRNILRECREAGIKFFDCTEAMRKETKQLIGIGLCPPFAIVASQDLIENLDGEIFYGRKYPWGTCNINNPTHSDFALLYRLLIGYLSEPLIESTKDIYRFILEERKELRKKQRKVEEPEPNRKIGLFAGLLSAISLGAYALTKQYNIQWVTVVGKMILKWFEFLLENYLQNSYHDDRNSAKYSQLQIWTKWKHFPEYMNYHASLDPAGYLVNSAIVVMNRKLSKLNERNEQVGMSSFVPA